MALAVEDGVTLKGAVTWAFQFDGQPIFAGYRDLATDGIDKPVLNGFRALGMLGNTRLDSESSAALRATEILQNGVPAPEVDAIAARKAREVGVLLMHYRDDDVPGHDADVALKLTGLPAAARRVRVVLYRVDATHGNAFSAWQAMGSPQQPTADQFRRLEAAGRLQPDGAAQHLSTGGNALRLDVKVPTEGLALVRISW